MVNQENIIDMGRLHGVTVDIEEECTISDFEVIETMDENNAYPMLLGIDWVVGMNAVINLKKCNIKDEKKELREIVPLDPAEGAQYTDPARDYYEEDDIEQIYKITMRDED